MTEIVLTTFRSNILKKSLPVFFMVQWTPPLLPADEPIPFMAQKIGLPVVAGGT